MIQIKDIETKVLVKESITENTKRTIKLYSCSDQFGDHWIIELGKIPELIISNVDKTIYLKEKIALRQYDYFIDYY